MEKNVQYIKTKLDQFLKENNAYDAWYERYRLDNLMYNDEVPIEDFISSMIKGGERGIHSMFYSGIQGTVMCTKKGDEFIEKNKKCDILDNGVFSKLDGIWMDTWKTFIDISCQDIEEK